MIDILLKEDLKKYIENNYVDQDISIEEDITTLCDTNLNFENQYNLDEYVKKQLQNFNDILRQIIRDYNKKNNTKDSDIYKKANISKELFNKIINQKTKPSKFSLLSLAIALELSLDKIDKLLNSAGFALTNTDKFDLIVKYCIEKGIYDITLINEILYEYKMKLLGSNTSN